LGGFLVSLKSDYLALTYGLDEQSSLTSPQRGRLIGCENYELTFGETGYLRTLGYERFDGRAAPSDATYYIVPFDAGGTTAIAAGDTITTGTGSGIVLRVSVTTGSWAGSDASGNLYVTAYTGTITNDQVISVSASPRATAADDAEIGLVDSTGYATDIASARDHYRNLITKPTGEGAILGVKLWDGVCYCMRNAVGGATATLWKSTSSGWSAVRTGMRPGGAMRAVIANFFGNTSGRAMYGVDGKNRLWKWDGTTFTFMATGIYGSEGTSTSNVTPGTGAKVFTVTETVGAGYTLRDWVAGQSLTIYSAADASKIMVGTVTSYVSPTLTMDISSASGAAAADWHITRTDGIDRPFTLAEHRNYMMLAYPEGQLQTSSLGEPLTYEAITSANAFGIGSDIADLVSLRGETLAVLSSTTIFLLYGSGSEVDPWVQKKFSKTTNCRFGSAKEISGNAVFLSDSGVLTLAGAQAYGDFEAGNLSAPARTTERYVTSEYTCCNLVKSVSQYRVYGKDKAVMVMTWFADMPRPGKVQFTRLRYEHQPVCADADTYNDDEFLVFGTSDGYVMRERKGTTFDGEDIAAFLRTSYWHYGSPQVKKRFRKLMLDVQSGLTTVNLYFRQDLDFGGPDQQQAYLTATRASGGFYDSAYYDQFYYDDAEIAQIQANVDGVARHMSLMIYSSGDTEPHRVSAIHTLYSDLSVQR
jgi:hypothetical protein